jgi:CheY-like chemotaxis protein
VINRLPDVQIERELGTDARAPLRILVADDDQGVLRVLNHVVRFLGHVVVGTAIDGHECVQRAKQLRPDLIIADLSMPRCDGIGTAAAISRNSKVPIIITTGATDEETLNRLTKAEIAGHLAKPFKLDEVRTAIDTATKRQVALAAA